MQQLCRELQQQLPSILAEWQTLAADEPWHGLPPEHRLDDLPEVLDALLDVMACSTPEKAECSALVWAAVRHGQARRGQGIGRDLLFTEYYFLRGAVWAHLRRADADHEAVRQAVMRLDVGMTECTRASLLGYFHPEHERNGRWPSVIDGLLSDSPLTLLGR